MSAIGAGVELFAIAVASAIALPGLIVALQVVAAQFPHRRASKSASLSTTRPRLAVLMPAHNEEQGVAESLAPIVAQLRAGDRLLVVADNCDDETAAMARASGAEVVERHDAERRGKGYALDFGVRALSKDPPELVIVIDADCAVGDGALDRLAMCCQQTGRPVQALYMMRAQRGARLATRIGELAWMVKNLARPLGNLRLGLPCQLMGTGMAFPWALIETAPLASGHLVEDMQLGIDLAVKGAPPLFCPEATVTSFFPSDGAAAVAQRTRWEHGHLSVLASLGPGLLLQALRRRQPMLAGLAFDLMVPPLAALVLAQVVGLSIASIFFVWTSSPIPLLMVSVGAVALSSGVLLAWWQYGRRILAMEELLAVPLYVLAKVPMYVRAFTKRQVEWVRTRRDGNSH